MAEDQDNSDPLPYTQVDRAVKPKAALLAGHLKVTAQHALGSLIEFWDLCGDPRELEALLSRGIEKVVLPADEVARRFRLASGHEIDPATLASLGLLEPQPEGLRVRGMSRYFKPVRTRLNARNAAKAGGKKSAEVRKATTGTAQPPRSGSGSESASRSVRTAPEPPPKRPRSDAEADAEATPEAAPNTAVSGQRSAVSPQRTAAVGPPPENECSGSAFFAWTQHKRQQVGLIREKPPLPSAMGSFFSEAMMELNGDMARLKAAYLRFGEDKFWQGADPPCPFNAFMSEWRRYVPAGRPRV